MRLIGPGAHLLVRAFWSKFKNVFVIDAAKRWRTLETDVIVHCCHTLETNTMCTDMKAKLYDI